MHKDAKRMRKLSTRQRQILNALINETNEFAPPTFGRLVERVELSTTTVRQALDRLQIRDFVIQDYEYGPYRPLKDADGNELQWGLVKKAA